MELIARRYFRFAPIVISEEKISNGFSRSKIRNNQLTTFKDNLPALPPREGVRRRVMIRMADVKCLVNLVALWRSIEFFNPAPGRDIFIARLTGEAIF